MSGTSIIAQNFTSLNDTCTLQIMIFTSLYSPQKVSADVDNWVKVACLETS